MTTSAVTEVDAGPQRIARRVVVNAPAAEVFAIVIDPHRHPELDEYVKPELRRHR